MKTTLNFFSGLLLAVLFVACGPTVQTVKMNNADLSEYKTFAYLPNSNFDDSDLGYNDETVANSVIESVNQNLKEAGYTLNRENPDLLVLLRTSVDKETTTTRDPVYASYPYALSSPVSPYYDPYYYTYYNDYAEIVGYDVDTYTYKEGSLIIDLVDRNSKKVIWRGTASDRITTPNSSMEITKYVDDVFKEFPKNAVADF